MFILYDYNYNLNQLKRIDDLPNKINRYNAP